ncbi:hypothetical protein C7S16_2227 [Burkholderia thailandensis]|uniref:Uncharacterized protein n=1 Tax=Burkholderia thailandensis TaxID=57975 RepID=A0AAW9CXI6_BURTH|nr:hypothetical protein [Burkholderia thailandensis]MDW9255345.1 hypothetical protein [Burkholderia thailandensis]
MSAAGNAVRRGAAGQTAEVRRRTGRRGAIGRRTARECESPPAARAKACDPSPRAVLDQSR